MCQILLEAFYFHVRIFQIENADIPEIFFNASAKAWRCVIIKLSSTNTQLVVKWFEAIKLLISL